MASGGAGSPLAEGANEHPEDDRNKKSLGPGGLAPEARRQVEDVGDGRSLEQAASEDGVNQKIANAIADAKRIQEANIPHPSLEDPGRDEGEDVPMDEGIFMDFDKEQEPVPTHGSTGGLFPGVEVKTVAFLVTRAGRKYINRYGPKTCPWFVIGDASYSLPDGDDKTLIEDEGYQCVTDPNCRKLDYPYKQSEKATKKSKKEDVEGILSVVSDLPLEVQGNPMEMVKQLDPSIVKKSNEITDLKSRRKAGLDKYPPTYLLLEFKTDVRPSNAFEEKKNRSWELSSKFRALHGTKGQISTEKAIYQTVLSRARRFLAWYKARQPDDFKQFEDLAQHVVALERTPAESLPPVPVSERTPSKSPSPPPVSGVTVKKEPRDGDEEPTGVQGSPTDIVTSQVLSGTGRSDPVIIPSDDEDVQLTEEEKKKEAEPVWKTLNKVDTERALTPKEKARFNVWYKLAKANKLVD